MERMRKEMVELLSKYVEMDKEALELNLEQDGDQVALMLSIPVIRAKDEEEIKAALEAEEKEKTSENEEEIESDEEETIEDEKDSDEVEIIEDEETSKEIDKEKEIKESEEDKEMKKRLTKWLIFLS
ncbi:MAG: cell division topological specificity factor MinE [Candidatus Gastranaerophilaceae bacterium]